MINIHKQNLANNNIYIIAVILSLLFSVVTTYNALPNNDGITYLRAAENFLNIGFKEALIGYHWPFYPILIAVISKVANLDLLSAAYILNAVLQAGIVVSFLQLFQRLSNSHSMLWLALLTIIIFPQFNEYRHYILRDYGFWLFSLLAVINLIDYCAAHDNEHHYRFLGIRHWCFYFINFTLAFLFRSEALLIALIMPIAIIFLDLSRAQKKSILLKMSTPVLVVGLISIILGFLILAFNSSSSDNTTLEYLYNNSHLRKLNVLVDLYSLNMDIVNKYIFFITPNDTLTSISFFIFGLFAVFVIKFIATLNVLNVFLLLVFFKLYFSNQIPYLIANKNNNTKLILLTGVLTSLLPLAFLVMIFVTSGRYYMLGSFLFLLFVPFSLHYLWQKLTSLNSYSKYKIPVMASITVLIVSLTMAGLITSGYSKEYIRQAGLWYKLQNLPREQAISNNSQLNYFAKLPGKAIDNLDLVNTNNFKYLLVKVGYKDLSTQQQIKELEANNSLVVLTQFSNKRHDTVFIIQNNNKLNG